jgi:phage terminase small subunit
MKKLTNKQKRFVDEYLIDLNGGQAALRAGYSPKTADTILPSSFLIHQHCEQPNQVQVYLKEKLCWSWTI